jgi:hypothetical protein
MHSLAYSILPLSLCMVWAMPAHSQVTGVLVTEVQSNPAGTGTDDGEWIEIQNTTASTVSIAGWQLRDFVGSADPANVSSTSWVFTSSSSLAPNQIIVVAKTASGFRGLFGLDPSYELGLRSSNSTSTPDLVATGGNNVIALSNSASGDGVQLLDELGAVVDEVEWGTLDRSVAGSPADRPGDGQSLVRVDVTGSSHVDFVVSSAPSPFVGYGSNLPPNIADVNYRPRHAVFGESMTVSATIADLDGIAEASVFLTTATSTFGAAIMPYQQVSMTSTIGDRYVFSAPIENLAAGLGFNEPANFHERFVRMFISAEDSISTTATWPADATELSDNPRYRWRNVLPTTPTTVERARAQDPDGTLRWDNLSVWVKGRATSSANVFRADRINFTIDDGNSGIAIYSLDGAIPVIENGTEVEVLGVLEQYYGLAQITEPALVVRVLGGAVAPVAPEQVASIAALLNNAETLESRVITLQNLEFVEPTQTWTADGAGGGSNYLVTDGTGQVAVRVWSGVDLVGVSTPTGKFNLTAVLSQRSMDGRDGLLGGYQLWPRSKEDVAEPVMADAGGLPNDTDGSVPSGMDAGVSPPIDGVDSGVPTQQAPRGKDPIAEDGCSCYAANSSPDSSVVWPMFLLAAWVCRRWPRRS